MYYGAKLSADVGGGFVVTFRDIPEAITQGDTKEEALEMAADALLTAMDFYFEEKRKVPLPSLLKKGEHGITLPPSVIAKVFLLNEMLEQKVTPAALSRRLNLKRPSDAQRLVDLKHSTKIDAIDAALGSLGKRLEIRVA